MNNLCNKFSECVLKSEQQVFPVIQSQTESSYSIFYCILKKHYPNEIDRNKQEVNEFEKNNSRKSRNIKE